MLMWPAQLMTEMALATGIWMISATDYRKYAGGYVPNTDIVSSVVDLPCYEHLALVER